VTLLLVGLVAAELVHFHNYKVLRFNIENDEQKKIIRDLNLDVWSYDSELVFGLNDIMVNPEQLKELASRGINHVNVMIEDVEQHLSNERETLATVLADPQADWFAAYHPLTEIIAHYANLTAVYPHLVETWVPSIGTSIQERNIPALIITSKNGAAKKSIYIEGGQHAREWVSHTTVAYITEQLLAGYGTDADATAILDAVKIVIVPVVNVDGYVFTWESNRLWRKNRRLNTGGSYGVDLNRNWDDHFGGDGSSSNPSSDTYHGTAPFSEPESKAASDFFVRNGPYVGAIDYHSYSQLILRPYGWTTALPPNDAIAKRIGDGVRDTIRSVHGVQYTSEGSWELYYTAGTAQDWFYAAGKTPLAYTIELRDTGAYGFQLPPAQIIPTGQENLAGFKYFVKEAIKEY